VAGEVTAHIAAVAPAVAPLRKVLGPWRKAEPSSSHTWARNSNISAVGKYGNGSKLNHGDKITQTARKSHLKKGVRPEGRVLKAFVGYVANVWSQFVQIKENYA
jgi:hypothetical protein